METIIPPPAPDKPEGLASHLFFEISIKNKNKAQEIMQTKITKYKFTKRKERNKTPNKNPKQIE
jgi:hypothetical protein